MKRAKSKLFILSLAVSLFLVIPSVFSLGISPAAISIKYEPGYENTFIFKTEKRSDVGVSIEGDLAEYFKIEKNEIAQKGEFVVSVKLPDKIEKPGESRVFVRLIETGNGGGMVSGIASIRTPIIITVPYGGIFAEFSVDARDVNQNETGYIYLNARNRGDGQVERLTATVEIYDYLNEKVEAIGIPATTLGPDEYKQLSVTYDPGKLGAGDYRAVASVTYDKNQKDVADSFRIGNLNIQLVNYTKEIVQDTVDEFTLKLESGWNDEISDVYAEIALSNATGTVASFKTVSFDLEPWERKEVSTFLDAKNLGVGPYDLQIAIRYQGKNQIESGMFDVIVAPEKSSAFAFSSYMNMTTLLFVVVVALIIINLIVLMKRRKQ